MIAATEATVNKEFWFTMTQEQFVPDIEQVKKVSLKFQEVFQRMDREIGVLDGIIAELDQQIQTTR